LNTSSNKKQDKNQAPKTTSAQKRD